MGNAALAKKQNFQLLALQTLTDSSINAGRNMFVLTVVGPM